ncbi:MAG: TRAP transporter small permease [Alphaproteobacteria bacterium]|nr:MAG: TRAP transporter small permease [Alphaproteobacteria bacterium]
MTLAGSAERAVGRRLAVLCHGLAYFGGLVLVALAVITVISIIGRALVPFGLSPVRGDFELVEAGCAVAVFSFLPWCQLNRGHVTVDVFIQRLPDRVQAALGLVGDTLIAIISGVILWRLWAGFGEKFPYGDKAFRDALGMGPKPFFPETTYELEMPVWIPYGLAVVGAAMFFVVSVYTVWRALNWTLEGREHAI